MCSGGHSVEFAGKRVYPIPFLLKHCPVSSQDHGLRKIFKEWYTRFDLEERAAGWHIQYDLINQNTSFIVCAEQLRLFDENATKTHLLCHPLKPPLK